MTTSTQNTMDVQNKLPAIVILTHGELGNGLVNSASMIFGADAQNNVHAICLGPQENPDDYKDRVEKTLLEVSEGSLFFIDIFGGTPFNTLVKLSRERVPYAIAGVSMPMLLEALTLRTSLSGKELLDAIFLSSKEGIINVTEMLNTRFGRK